METTYLFSLFQREMIKKERAYSKLIQELSITKNGLNDQVLANQKLVEGILSALILALEAKDPYTEGHSRRVSKLAQRIAKSMGLSPDKCERVRLAGLFHDIGKIGIPDMILFKKGPLTDAEYDEIKKHPANAVKILEPVDPFHKLLPAVLHHHENWDGTGYPERLKESQIPLAASIIHVADSYDAMTSHRSYRTNLSPAAAYQEIVQKSGTLYDPKVVKHFAELFGHLVYPGGRVPAV